MSQWMVISQEKQPNGAPVPKKVRVRALSCLASSQWELRQLPEKPDVWNMDSVWRAGVFADDCASLGFVSPMVLGIGRKIQELMTLPNIPEARHPRFQGLVFLWEAVERRQQEINAEQEKHNDKVAKTPNLFVCAAPGCGIEATRKSALLKCAGNCPSDVKPSYCSKECQKAVSDFVFNPL